MNQAAHYSEGLLGLQQVADKLAEFGRHILYMRLKAKQ